MAMTQSTSVSLLTWGSGGTAGQRNGKFPEGKRYCVCYRVTVSECVGA